MPTGKSRGKPAASARKNSRKAGGSRPIQTKPTDNRHRAAPARQLPKPGKFPERKPTADEIAHQQALQRFTSALELMNQGQFTRAKGLFERLVEHPSREIGERSKVYLNICTQRSTKLSLQLKTVDDLYDYAVSLANEGHPEQAEEHLRKALKLSPKADFLYYALAATFALRNDVEGTLEYLDKAIQLDQRNRYQAQNDPDFEGLLEDPRFTELIYPERPLN